MNTDLITPVILTFDEEANLGRALSALAWAPRLVVLDSGSTDATERIARSHPNADFHTRPFDNHTAQWNHALSLVRTEWILSLDADYVATPDLLQEIRTLDASSRDGFFIPFTYVSLGRPLHASLLPPRLALFRKDRAAYVPDGHTQLLQLNGTAGHLRQPLLHDDRKPLARWLRSQLAYADLELSKLRATPWADLSLPDRLRKHTPLAPLLVALLCLFGKGLLGQGAPGWFYTAQRITAEIILLLRRWESAAKA